MHNKKTAGYISLGISTVGVGLFVFLYNFPYHKVANVRYHDFINNIDHLALNSKSTLEITGKNLPTYSVDVKAHVFSAVSDYQDFVDKIGMSNKKFDKKFFETGGKLLAIGYQGTVMTYTKINKVSVNTSAIDVNYSVENDFILDGSAHPDDPIYTYDLIPLRYQGEILAKKVNISVKKV